MSVRNTPKQMKLPLHENKNRENFLEHPRYISVKFCTIKKAPLCGIMYQLVDQSTPQPTRSLSVLRALVTAKSGGGSMERARNGSTMPNFSTLTCNTSSSSGVRTISGSWKSAIFSNWCLVKR